MFKIILGLCFLIEALTLTTSNGSTAMKGIDTASLIAFIVIGVITTVIIAACCYFASKKIKTYDDGSNPNARVYSS